MSPASGDKGPLYLGVELEVLGFHSINVPSEWGLFYYLSTVQTKYCVSIQLMSPASGDKKPKKKDKNHELQSFHSINVPSEWGQLK